MNIGANLPNPLQNKNSFRALSRPREKDAEVVFVWDEFVVEMGKQVRAGYGSDITVTLLAQQVIQRFSNVVGGSGPDQQYRGPFIGTQSHSCGSKKLLKFGQSVHLT